MVPTRTGLTIGRDTRQAVGRAVLMALFGVRLLAGPAHAESPTSLHLARLSGVPDQLIGSKILREIYDRLKITVTFVDAPASRALALSSSGEVDGEVHRIADVSRTHPSLLQVTPAINYIEPAVFTTKLRFEIQGWESIRSYEIGIVRGVGSSERGTAGMPRVQTITSLDNLALMLDAGRVDLLVTDLLSGLVKVKEMQLEERIYALTPPLERIYIYHYLHQRHRDLVPKVSAVVQAMEGSGELAQLRARFVSEVLQETVANVPAGAAGRR